MDILPYGHFLIHLICMDISLLWTICHMFFLHIDRKNHPKKLHSYGSWEFYFLCSPNCPKQPRTSFPFYNSFIQPSLVGSLFGRHQEATEDFFLWQTLCQKITTKSQWANFSVIVYIAVRIHVMFDYMNHNIGFFMEKILCYDSCLCLTFQTWKG